MTLLHQLQAPVPGASGPPEHDWVSARLGARIEDAGGTRPVASLVQLALRHNPRRAHLLVSGVLGKHVPADPETVHSAGVQLAHAVEPELGPTGCVIGYAETATALGHVVAEVLRLPYLHSTRRVVAGVHSWSTFEEEHSHAVAHRLLPERPELFAAADTVVLVDDELSTGRTVRNTIAALHAHGVHRSYVVACLVDMRADEDAEQMAAFAAQLGVRIQVVCLARGRLVLPESFDADARAASGAAAPVRSRVGVAAIAQCVRWPRSVRDGGRHGFLPSDARAAAVAADRCAGQLAAAITGRSVLVLGTEELMYAPLLVARALGRRLAGAASVRFSSTTRSPVVAVDEPGYPVRTRLTFAAHDGTDVDVPRFAHNVAPSGDPSASGTGYSDIVLVIDDVADSAALRAPDGLLAALCGVAGRVHLLVVPSYRPMAEPLHGPAFGSYAADEVSWLLTDISAATLERPTAEREIAIQTSAAHYSESLPVEYQPSAQYLDAFERCLDENARAVAEAVGVLTEQLVAEHGGEVVIASLARAGTPIGILVRRWARAMHGLDLPHYTLSIIRGRGIDAEAMRYLATRHDERDVVFVDGWTGKGAIARELLSAVADCNARLGTSFTPDLAVLADPGRCATTFGTRSDLLVPSACLNSTVSGLVSRTVLNEAIVRPGQFHGAKFYRALSGVDRSASYLDAVTVHFAAARPAVAARWRSVQDGDRTRDWSGWSAVESIAARHGVADLNLVKPGVGETTRVLLRRVPWRVLVRPDARAELAHVLLLAADRGVAVVDERDLPFSCVGLIRPGGPR